MKWNELSIRDKTQLYKRIKQQNPQTTWFDLKTQFDAIPQFEDDMQYTTKQIIKHNKIN